MNYETILMFHFMSNTEGSIEKCKRRKFNFEPTTSVRNRTDETG